MEQNHSNLNALVLRDYIDQFNFRDHPKEGSYFPRERKRKMKTVDSNDRPTT